MLLVKEVTKWLLLVSNWLGKGEGWSDGNQSMATSHRKYWLNSPVQLVMLTETIVHLQHHLYLQRLDSLHFDVDLQFPYHSFHLQPFYLPVTGKSAISCTSLSSSWVSILTGHHLTYNCWDRWWGLQPKMFELSKWVLKYADAQTMKGAYWLMWEIWHQEGCWLTCKRVTI